MTQPRPTLQQLYLPPTDRFTLIDVPRLPYFMLDGDAPPRGPEHLAAIRWLFSAVYPIKRIAKERMGPRFVEPPLEGLWWADDWADFAAGRPRGLRWRMMIPAPDWADGELFETAVVEVEERLGERPATLRLEEFEEGPSAQIQFVGPPQEQRATVVRLFEEFLPSQGLVAHGAHHEIYLTDPKRTAPEKMRTVLRQPVCAEEVG